MLPDKIVLGTKPDGKPLEYPLEMPRSYAARLDLAVAAGKSVPRAAAAAVGLACPRLCRELKVKLDTDCVAFGGAVIDAFAKACEEHGVKGSPGGLIKQGIPILNELVASISLDGDEVTAAEDFSDPPLAG